MLQGGVKAEKVADWLVGMSGTVARARKRFFWIGALSGAVLFAVVSVWGYQNISYRSKLKKQSDLLSQIHDLEIGLDGVVGNGVKSSAEKVSLLNKLLAAERQLFQIREKLRLPDRVPTYRNPLGADVHLVLEELGKKEFIVPESFIRSVQEQIDFFCKPGNRATLVKCFLRKPRYEAMIHQELAKMKLPLDFLYIPMQESLLDSNALSGNSARGLWQMVPETARDFDLRVPVDWETRPSLEDERTRPHLATKAAAKYLHLLYSEFGDAALTLAAYNAGGNKMRRGLSQIDDPVNDRDFWYLYRMGVMQTETHDYVPRIIAMILIDRNRDKYGFKATSH